MRQDERIALQAVVDELLALRSYNDDLMRAGGGVLVRLADLPVPLVQKCEEAAEMLAGYGLEAPELSLFLQKPSPTMTKPLIVELKEFCLDL